MMFLMDVKFKSEYIFVKRRCIFKMIMFSGYRVIFLMFDGRKILQQGICFLIEIVGNVYLNSKFFFQCLVSVKIVW